MNKNAKLILIVSVIIIGLIISFFINQNHIKSQNIVDKQENEPIIFGLATGSGGLGDKAFNDMQFNGMLMAKRNYDIKFIYDSPMSETDDFQVIEGLIKKKAKVVILGGGFHMVDPLDSLATLYPDIKFVILDDKAKNYYPNVASIMFKQNEGSFLVGALAALESKTNHIAMIGAINIDIINDFYEGYKAGAKYINPNINVSVRYIADYNDETSPFANPQRAYKIAESLYKNSNVDIIYQVAAGSGLGVFNAAKQFKKYAIGVDSDQDYLAETYILTSMMKRLDIGINMIIGNILEGKFENKPYKLGLKENGISLSEMKFTKEMINADTLQKLKSIESDIINGKIIVPTLYP